MAKENLTDRRVQSLKPAAPGTRYAVSDALVPGLKVRVTAVNKRGTYTRTFVLFTRYPGSPHAARRELGKVGELTLLEARDKARAWLALIQRGVDPRQEQARRRDAESERRANTFGVVIEEFVAKHLRGKRKAVDAEREIRRELIPRWAGKPVSDITRRDVVKLVDEIVARGAKYQAHNVLGHVRKFFNWAINRGLYGIEHSPCDRLRPAELIGTREPRQRTLTDDELRAVWRAAGRMGYPWGPMYQLLMLTGQRKTEVSDARWGEFDFAQNLWTIPPERFKSNAQHRVPLTDDAVAVLLGLPRWAGGQHLFSTLGGAIPVDGFSKAKRRLDRLVAEELGYEPARWVIHDIRRTVRTRLSGLRVPEPVAEMVIGHARRGLLRVYDQHTYSEEMREALELWATRLRGIVAAEHDRDSLPPATCRMCG
jgi:integrase